MLSSNIFRRCCCLKRSSKNCYPLNESEIISLDSGHLGQDVVVLKKGMRVCGSGGAVLNQALLQSKSYFEVKIQQGGYYSVGIALLETDLNRPRAGPGRWTLNAENYVMNNGQIAYDLNEMYSSNIISTENTATEQLLTPPPSSLASQRSPLPQEGDIIGVTYDHIELNFYVNGKNLNVPMLIQTKLSSNASNTEYNNLIYPCLFVDDGAILDLIVDGFNYAIPQGFDKIMVEQTLL